MGREIQPDVPDYLGQQRGSLGGYPAAIAGEEHAGAGGARR
jgi:hypothetical protein